MIICVLQCDDLADQVAVETERRACPRQPGGVPPTSRCLSYFILIVVVLVIAVIKELSPESLSIQPGREHGQYEIGKAESLFL